MILPVGLEPTPREGLDPKSSVAANYTKGAYEVVCVAHLSLDSNQSAATLPVAWTHCSYSLKWS